jgi:hypothetical protein
MARRGLPFLRAFLLHAVCAAAAALGACGGSEPPSTPATFEEDAEAVRLVRSVREGLAQGQRPGTADVQRLKDIARRYPEDAFVEQAIMGVLPPLLDWDGMVAYLEGKDALTDEQRMLLTRVYIQQAAYERARLAITPLADREPENVQANALAGRANFFLGENVTAARYYDRVWPGILEQGLDAEIANRAMIHFDADELDRARELLENELVGTPDSIELCNALSRVLAAVGDAEGSAMLSARVSKLQEALSLSEQRGKLRAAQTNALNEAWGERDFDKCLSLVYEILPGADESFREELYGFLAGMYKAVGREEEVPAVLQKARQHANRTGER